MEHFIAIDEKYKEWLKEVGNTFQKSQIKAATKVNEEMLEFYYWLGGKIGTLKSEISIGNSFYDEISKDLCKMLPDVKSFSPTNLKYMQYFHELYSSPQAVDLDKRISMSPQLVDFDRMIFKIPWGHHRCIIDKCKKDRAKAIFFIKKTLENNWSRAVLLNFLDTNLFERQGSAISNFNKVLPDLQSDLAQEMTKDPYNFDFLTMREGYNEKELKDALMKNVQSFLLELGMGFAFVGREYRLEIGKTEQFLDMLFYNISNHCYVVIEIKIRDFQSGDMGQLGTYVAAVDGILKSDNDNQTIGLLICKTKDNVLAKYAVNTMNVPIGISEYDMSHLISKDYKSNMPTIEEIENELKK